METKEERLLMALGVATLLSGVGIWCNCLNPFSAVDLSELQLLDFSVRGPTDQWQIGHPTGHALLHHVINNM